MRFQHHRALAVTGFAMALLLVVGCTVRPEETETLDLCGNHTCGTLYMVTADTSSSGYSYEEPSVSPDGTRVAFTIDWPALVPTGLLPDTDPLIRQIVVIDKMEHYGAQLSLEDEGAALVDLNDLYFAYAGSQERMRPNVDWQKGSPTWLDDGWLLFWMQTARGARLFRAYLGAGFQHGDEADAEVIWQEPDDPLLQDWLYWEHLNPSVSPDGHWIAFSRYGHADADSLHMATQQSIWVCAVPEAGEVSDIVFAVTEEASTCDWPDWSPDGSKIVFSSSLDITDDAYDGYYTQELFTVDFDTTGYAASGEVATNNNLERLTYSPPAEGSNFVIRNQEPCYSNDGTKIVFVSDRRVPTLTLTERNIWYIPSDGSLDPQIVFFSRSDDTSPAFTGGAGRELVLSSSFGFPTDILDEVWQSAYDQLEAENPDWNELLIQAEADAIREKLEFFEDVSNHIYVLSDW